jgi:hypothetical protein
LRLYDLISGVRKREKNPEIISKISLINFSKTYQATFAYPQSMHNLLQFAAQ